MKHKKTLNIFSSSTTQKNFEDETIKSIMMGIGKSNYFDSPMSWLLIKFNAQQHAKQTNKQNYAQALFSTVGAEN